MICAAIAFFLASVPAAAQVPGTADASAVGVATQTVSTLYTGDRVRDPFLSAAMGAAASVKIEAPKTEGGIEVVDIHGMSLRGIMKDASHDYALFTADSGASYMLRGGKLYNDRNKPVPGIAGRIKLKQKTVELITTDKDVQVFRLGEDEKEKEKEKQ